jgi:hypothetical protein
VTPIQRIRICRVAGKFWIFGIAHCDNGFQSYQSPAAPAVSDVRASKPFLRWRFDCDVRSGCESAVRRGDQLSSAIVVRS